MRLEREGFVQLQIAVISGVGTGKGLAPGSARLCHRIKIRGQATQSPNSVPTHAAISVTSISVTLIKLRLEFDQRHRNILSRHRNILSEC